MPRAEVSRVTVNQNDTADLTARIYDTELRLYPESAIESVIFTVKTPDGNRTTGIEGGVQADGSGLYRWANTTQIGTYQWIAQFHLYSGEIRSDTGEFTVQDPLEAQAPTYHDQIANAVWMRLEDAFDSEEGGPWLRDKTLAWFEKPKIKAFIGEGLIFINSWPPLTTIDISYFTTSIPSTDPNELPGTLIIDPDQGILVQATLLSTIRHLMRSYVEQPDPRGANIVWQSRRDYLERWQSIYQIEWEWFKDILTLWKRQFFNYGKSALLVGSKAGRLYPPGMRTRNAMRGIL